MGVSFFALVVQRLTRFGKVFPTSSSKSCPGAQTPSYEGCVSSIDSHPLYESRLWYPVVLKVYGGSASPSLRQLISKVTDKVALTIGRVLDVACGPGTYGRRVASASREVFGIDVSMGMLRQGAVYVKKERIPNMHFARARSKPFHSKAGSLMPRCVAVRFIFLQTR